MKLRYSQSLDDQIERDHDSFYDPKPPVSFADCEPMNLHELELAHVNQRLPSVLPRSASYAERLAEWSSYAGMPDDLI